MKTKIFLIPVLFGWAMLFVFSASCHEGAPQGKTNAVVVQSIPGANAWNAGRAPADWWEEIRRQHGHVGPWNILGWRIAQAALREFKSDWGRHELDIVCYLPPQTPYTCLVDGVAVGSGNSIGRMDLRLAEVFEARQSFVAVRRKNGSGPVLEFRVEADYLKSIINQPLAKLENLSRECVRLPEKQLFRIVKVAD
jgi:formylmethanofuran dehydrogenase subunit E